MAQITTTPSLESELFVSRSLSTDELIELAERYQRELETVRSERDNALRAFGDSQKQLAATQVRAKIGTWESWIDSDRVYLSERSYRILGFQSGDSGPSFEQLRQLIHPADRTRVIRTFEESERLSRGATLIFRVCRQDGEIRSIRCEYVVTEDPAGRPWRMLGVIQDVTDVSDRAIERHPISVVSTAAEYCPFILIYFDLDGTIKFVNRAMQEEIPSMEVGESIFYYTTYESETVRDVMRRVIKMQRPVLFDFDNVSQAGERRIFDAWIGPVVKNGDVDGFVLSVLGPFNPDYRKLNTPVGSDNIPTLDAGQIIHAQRIAKVGYWAFNYDTKDSIWSPEKFRILGLSEESSFAGSDTILELVVPEDHSILINAESDAEENEEAFEVQYRIVRPDGETRSILSCGEIVYNNLLEKTLVGTIQDITDRKFDSESLRNSELKYRALFEEMSQTHQDMSSMTRKLSTIQEEERRRISLELHDDVGGLLSGLQIIMHLNSIPQTETDEYQSRASAMVDEIIERVDRLTHQLRPSSLDQFGLESTLFSHFREFETLYNISLDADIKIHNENLISEEVEIAAFRIIQEALNNVARHAGVTVATVRISQKKQCLKIRISDQGRGISEQNINTDNGGIGLEGMEERTLLLGGTLKLDTAPGEGTTIRVRLPI